MIRSWNFSHFAQYPALSFGSVRRISTASSQSSSSSSPEVFHAWWPSSVSMKLREGSYSTSKFVARKNMSYRPSLRRLYWSNRSSAAIASTVRPMPASARFFTSVPSMDSAAALPFAYASVSCSGFRPSSVSLYRRVSCPGVKASPFSFRFQPASSSSTAPLPASISYGSMPSSDSSSHFLRLVSYAAFVFASASAAGSCSGLTVPFSARYIHCPMPKYPGARRP